MGDELKYPPPACSTPCAPQYLFMLSEFLISDFLIRLTFNFFCEVFELGCIMRRMSHVSRQEYEIVAHFPTALIESLRYAGCTVPVARSGC